MTVVEPLSRPLLIYDGTCSFCRAWIARWKHSIRDRIDYAPYQEVGSRFPEIPIERFAREVHLLEPNGRWSSGAEAVFRALAYASDRRWPLWLYRHVPGIAPACNLLYRTVARHRPFFDHLTRWIWSSHLVPPGETLSAWIFLRALAVVYLIAFVSAWIQIAGLAGSHGILPAGVFLDAVRARYGPLGLWLAPTAAWVSSSDLFLNALCAIGVCLSLLLAVGGAPVLCLAGLWFGYLSVSIAGQDFFWFQWDSLLIEAGFLSVFLAPWRWWSHPATDPPPPRAALWLLRWLLIRVSISSAAVKLLSHDPTWHNLTALTYHFQTQPLPTWTAWYVHHLPAPLLRGATLGTMLVEGLGPLLIFGPRRIRFLGVGTVAILQVLILITGNYGFFNWLTLALCIVCLDDGVWPKQWRDFQAKGARGGGRWFPWVVKPVAAVLVVLSLVPFLETLRLPTHWLGPIEDTAQALLPFRTLNRYGLFAVMTTRRMEIVLEGSADGLHWLPYEFRSKPGDPRRRPDFIAPHQPRLDWQMWFAALSDFRQQPWFLVFCKRLLEGSPPVLALLAENPFPRAPPRYIRALVYDYRLTDPATRRKTGAWWQRDLLGLYCPVLTLENGRLSELACSVLSMGQGRNDQPVHPGRTPFGVEALLELWKRGHSLQRRKRRWSPCANSAT